MEAIDLKDKYVLITGAGSGIGIGFVKSFHQRGSRLLLCDIDGERLSTVIAQYGGGDGDKRHRTFVRDLRRQDEREALVRELNESGIEVDVLVNNAGIGYRSYLADAEWGALQGIVDLNVVATTHLCWLLLPGMKRKNSGGIINVSSTGAFCGADTASVYTGTKAYIANFTEGLSMELFGTNVRALSAHPGATDTNFWDASGWKNSNYNQWIHMMPPDVVAEEFVRAFERGSATVIAGTKNKLMVAIAKFVPRELLKRAAVRKYR
jgi:short-subunit dehydrogenase